MFTSVIIRSRFTPHFFERKAAENGFLVCGIDEVGRGPLAGPIVASAVILNHRRRFPSDLIDSKVLSCQRRERMYDWICRNGLVSVALISGRRIDELSIGRANHLVMERALAHLVARYNVMPSCVLVDAVPLVVPWLTAVPAPGGGDQEGNQDPFVCPCNKILSFFEGETKSRSIAAASIVAKVFRDRLMTELAGSYPRYEFHRHKGYATHVHLDHLRTTGCSIVHRKSFLRSMGSEQVQLSLLDDSV